jgi:cyanophycin synthetase
LIALTLDDEAMRCLEDQDLSPESIPQKGCFVYLRLTANISTGGTAVDVTALVHADNRKLAERAARLVGLDIAGVDFLCPDISRSWFEVGGAVIEVNGQPGFRSHWLSEPDRDINGEIIDWLFRNKSSRIPTAAITGTNGKSSTARMLHHIWMTSGKNAGVCATNGVLVGYDIVTYKNLSGHPGGRILLEDPAVEAAVFEMPRKGLLLFGHPCDCYDVAALLEEMARLKAGVLERATQAIVVNAEDALCLEMRKYAIAPRHILVACNPLTPALLDHLDQRGGGVFTQMCNGRPWIVIAEGAVQSQVMPLNEIPATMNGLLRFNETNALFATALAWAQGLSIDVIRKALATFASTPEQNPGRFNFIEGFEFQVLLDYAHNPVGVRELCEMVSKLPVTGARRLLNLNIGSRHREHINETASCLAHTFDYFVLSCEPGRVLNNPEWAGDDPMGNMLTYSRNCLSAEGVSQEAMMFEPDNPAALKKIMDSGQPGDLLVLLSGPRSTLPFLNIGDVGSKGSEEN